MEWTVFQLLLVTVFPSGVLPTLPTLSPVQRQYYLITDLKSWPDAQTYCRTNYADLATVENDMDLIRIQREAQRLGFTSEAWVGLYNDINSWRCSRNNVPLGIWTDWATNQPDDLNGIEQCVLIGKDGKWRDGQCSATIPFICYDEKGFGLDVYKPYTDVKSWKDAQTFCRQSHTDLACPSNFLENFFVQTKAPTAMNWIGFYRDGWKWSDQTNDSDIKWTSGHPNNAGGNDNCGYTDKSIFSTSYNPWNVFFYGGFGTTDVYSGGWFNDGDCSVQRAFFCQTLPIPKKRQVVRVMVQSDQDMNDPTVKAALLEKIQQKLTEEGMVENPTLRWKEQSDGSVFSKKKEKRRENMENNTTRACEL